MQYCPQCRELQEGSAAVCGGCEGALRTPQPQDMVLLATDKEYEINSLCAALSEQDVIFEEKLPKMSLSSYKGRGFKGESSVFVHYQDLEAAKRIARNMGFHFPDDVKVTPLDANAVAGGKSALPQEQKNSSVGQKSSVEEAKGDVSPGKKKLGKILLFASVIAAMVAVVLLSDWVIGLIKSGLGQ